MHLVEEQWSLAYEDFFEAFKSYDEAGNSKKVSMALLSCRSVPFCHSIEDPTFQVTCLKYLVLANMLMKSSVDPFDAQEVCVGSRNER